MNGVIGDLGAAHEKCAVRKRSWSIDAADARTEAKSAELRLKIARVVQDLDDSKPTAAPDDALHDRGLAAAMRYFWAAVESDVTDLLSMISAPTLVLHPERDLIAPVEWGRFLADHIPHAEFVALDSDVDLICVSDVIDDMARHIGDFIQRMAPSPDTSRHVEPENGV